MKEIKGIKLANGVFNVCSIYISEGITAKTALSLLDTLFKEKKKIFALWNGFPYLR